VILQKQVRASQCPILLGMLSRLRTGSQTSADYDRLQGRAKESTTRDFTTGVRAIVPTNKPRLLLNIEAAAQYTTKLNKHMSIFLSKHHWKKQGTRKGMETENENDIYEVLSTPDASKITVPPFYIHVPGTPVMTTINERVGLKYVNGAEFESVGVIPDPRYPGYPISNKMTVHFGPPAGLLVTSKDIKDIQVPGLQPGTLLITPQSITITKKGSPIMCTRTGLPCIPAFAITGHKAQGSSFSQTLVDLLHSPYERKSSSRTLSESSITSSRFASLYVQLL